MKVVSREIASTILPKAQELLGELGGNAISHNDFCDLLLQRMYEESTGKSTPHHKMFEFVSAKGLQAHRGCTHPSHVFLEPQQCISCLPHLLQRNRPR